MSRQPQSIFFELSGGDLCNVGDVAMTQVAVGRMRAHFPQAQKVLVSGRPDRVAELFPGSHVASGRGRDLLFRPGSVMRSLRNRPALEELLRVRLGRAALAGAAAKRLVKRDGFADLRGFVRAVRRADVVVAAGGGWLNDSFAGHARATLETLEMAKRRGTPVGMFGQGIGPITDPHLRATARRVLPQLDVIALREGVRGPGLLAELGVPASRIVVTGDDAIELALDAAPWTLGASLGVNLRLAAYARVTDERAQVVRSVLRAWGEASAAPLVPLPISHCPDGLDREAIGELPNLLDVPTQPPRSLADPGALLARVALCRVVVSGSYHASVFALAQGIPTVCLVGSEYYRHKFEGLADMFGGGVHVVDAGEHGQLAERLRAAIDVAWESAPDVREALRGAAERQVDASRAAYERFCELARATPRRDPYGRLGAARQLLGRT